MAISGSLRAGCVIAAVFALAAHFGVLGNGMVWDDAALHAFLKDPKGFVAKTKMSFAGLKSDEDISAVIAYLRSIGG